MEKRINYKLFPKTSSVHKINNDKTANAITFSKTNLVDIQKIQTTTIQ